MDADTTSTRHAHEELLSQFGNQEYDILLGTQMIAKGLDFANVTLVGVLNADQSLYASDFRSSERTFSLLTQVVGRSGRGQKAGRALIQTYTPQNETIRLAAQQDYDAFYKEEIALRQANVYPPFCDICIVGFVGAREQDAQTTSCRFLEHLKKSLKGPYEKLPLFILGPTPASVFKVAGKYRYKLLIKCKNNRAFRTFLHEALDTFPRQEETRIFAEFNYDSLL